MCHQIIRVRREAKQNIFGQNVSLPKYFRDKISSDKTYRGSGGTQD